MDFYELMLDFGKLYLLIGSAKAMLVLATMPTALWAASRLEYGKGTRRVYWLWGVVTSLLLFFSTLVVWPWYLLQEGWQFFLIENKRVTIRDVLITHWEDE